MEAIKKFLYTNSIEDITGDGSGEGSVRGYEYGSKSESGDEVGYGGGSGDGSGSGYGSGIGSGYGSGIGSGSGYGSGVGSGYGSGSGSGSGDGEESIFDIKSINNQLVYKIDNVPTIITSLKNNVAKGAILKKDLTLFPCYVVKNDYCFAHGETLKQALFSLEEKSILLIPVEKRIESFKITFKDFHKKIKASILYDWHYKLTGSCKIGRDNFIFHNNINLSKDKFTVFEFIELTKNQYNGHIIKQIIEYGR